MALPPLVTLGGGEGLARSPREGGGHRTRPPRPHISRCPGRLYSPEEGLPFFASGDDDFGPVTLGRGGGGGFPRDPLVFPVAGINGRRSLIAGSFPHHPHCPGSPWSRQSRERRAHSSYCKSAFHRDLLTGRMISPPRTPNGGGKKGPPTGRKGGTGSEAGEGGVAEHQACMHDVRTPSSSLSTMFEQL